MLKNRKFVITAFVVAIVLIAVAGVAPAVISAFTGPGVKTEGLTDEYAKPAEVSLDGDWEVVRNRGDNATSVGFTFPELLPGDRRVTSGSTQQITGGVRVEDRKLVDGTVTVDMNTIESDNERRDINVRNKIFETDKFPTSEFRVTEPVDLSGVPDDGTAGEVELTGELTIHGVTRGVTAPFKVLRDRDRVVVSSTIPVNRLDYEVETPDFVAATIDEQGEINIRLTLRQP
ncbi:YceI family protein [Corynebacterium frankenforstense]|uniref:YceI family protein n=1 Tax=Corynebacterium frankenforstense TaxID=1230998 RepID=UPI00254F3BF1|nr:YceI family protein [Corynebacterium frankenforstense]MDK6260050.1 YceI family protein [Corynebacterium frankenforstense]